MCKRAGHSGQKDLCMHRQGGLKGWTCSSNSKKFSVARSSTKRSETEGYVEGPVCLIKEFRFFLCREKPREVFNPGYVR